MKTKKDYSEEVLKENFMDSYEDNDNITSFINDVLGEEYEVITQYHAESDGKHIIDISNKDLRDESLDERFYFNAWNTKEEVLEMIEESLKVIK